MVSFFICPLRAKPVPGNRRKVALLLVTNAETVVICAHNCRLPLLQNILLPLCGSHKKTTKEENIGDDAMKEFYSTSLRELLMGPE